MMVRRPRAQALATQSARWLWCLLLGWALTLAPAGCSDDAEDDPSDPDVHSGDVDPTPDADPQDTLDAAPDAGAGDVSVLDIPAPGPSDTRDDTSAPPDVDPDADAFVLQDGVDPDDATGPLQPAPVADLIDPAQGSTAGGDEVRLFGDHFEEGAEVFFGSRPAADVVTVSPFELLVTTPPAPASGAVNVRVVGSGGSATLPDGFLYVDALEIDAITPARSPTTGGVPFTLRGGGFNGPVAVSIGGRSAVDVVVLDEQTLTGRTPPAPLGPQDVRVTGAAGTVRAPGFITYYTPTQLDAVFPGAGPLTGGQTLTLSGQGFAEPLSVRLGAHSAQVLAVTPSAVTITTPPAAPGLVDVVVTGDGGVAVLDDGYRYVDDLGGPTSISDVIPDHGPAAGGAPVVINGQGFTDAAPVTVSFGASPPITVDAADLTSTSLRVLTPPGAPGQRLDVTVDVGGVAATAPGAYAYAATLDAVSPDSGAAAGGEPVTLSGQGFAPDAQVYFGNLAATDVVVVSDTLITATTPPGAAGATRVRVLSDGVEATLVDGFFYVDALEVIAITPQRGARAGGTLVTAFGRGFAPGVSVEVGGLPALDVTLLDGATLTFETPPHDPASVDVVITSTADSQTAPQPFVYYDPTSTIGGGWGGPVSGTINVTVLEIRSGMPVPEAFVVLSNDITAPHQGLTDANGQITFSGVDLQGVQTITASAEAFTTTTVTTIDAENVTLFLRSNAPPSQGGGDPPPTPEPSYLYGTVSGVKKTGVSQQPGLTSVAFVVTSQSSPFAPNPNPGAQNFVSQEDGPYRILSRYGDVAAIAVCGDLDSLTGDFTPRFIGLQRALFVAEGTEQRVDLECNIPLDGSATFKLVGSPLGQGTVKNVVIPYLNLGPEGYFGGYSMAEGPSNILHVPGLARLVGPFAQMSYLAYAYSEGPGPYVGGGIQTGDPFPFSGIQVDDLRDLSATIELGPMMGLPQMITPQDGGVLLGDRVEWSMTGLSSVDFHGVVLYDLSGGGAALAWEVYLPGDASGFLLPDLNNQSNTAGGLPPNGGVLMLLQSFKMRAPGYDFDSFSWQDLSTINQRSWSQFIISFNRF